MGRGSSEGDATTVAKPRNMRGEAVSAASQELRSKAEAVSAYLVEQGAQAVALFGSAARGTATEQSDLDLFVVWEGSWPRHSKLNLPFESEMSFNLWERVEQPQDNWGFLKMVASEAKILHDPDNRLRKAFENLPDPDPEALKDEAERLRSKLPTEDKLERYNGIYFFVYSDCYRWAKVAAMQANLLNGQVIYDREQSLRTLAERHPEIADDVKWLEAISPFYLTNMGKGDDEDEPFDSSGTEEEIRRSLISAQAVIDAACDEIEASARR